MGEAPRLRVVFFKTEHGREPVREWIKSLPRADQKEVGSEVKAIAARRLVGKPKPRFRPPWRNRASAHGTVG